MISKDFHASRRKLYADLLNGPAVGFVFSGREREDRGDGMYKFTPYANFYYLTGFTQPKAVLMITKTAGKVQETLFIDHPDEKAKRWLGLFYTTESVKEETGIENVQYLEKFEESLPFLRYPDRVEHVYIDIANWEGAFSMNEAQRFAAQVREYNPRFRCTIPFTICLSCVRSKLPKRLRCIERPATLQPKVWRISSLIYGPTCMSTKSKRISTIP